MWEEFSRLLFFLLWRLCCSSGNVVPYDQMFQMIPGSGDLTGHKMWTNSLMLVFIIAAQFFPLIWPCTPLSFTCLWCPSAAVIAFICPWGQTEVVRWGGNRFVYLVYLRIFSPCLRCVQYVCGEVRKMCEHTECLCHGFRFLWVIWRICISCYVLYVCLVSVALSLLCGCLPSPDWSLHLVRLFFSSCLCVSLPLSVSGCDVFQPFFSCSHLIPHCGSIWTPAQHHRLMEEN